MKVTISQEHLHVQDNQQTEAENRQVRTVLGQSRNQLN